MKQHPLSALFPAMPPDELLALSKDIKKRGLKHAITMHDGMCLDGWNRALACQMAGVPIRETRYAGDDPAGFVWSENIPRRHLTASQRALIEVQLRDWVPHGANKSRGAPGATLAEMAEESTTSERTIRQAIQVEKTGSDELKDAVKSGEISVKKAAEVAKQPKSKQPKALKEAQAPKPKEPSPEDEFAPDFAVEFERADKEILRLQGIIESMSKADLPKEVLKWSEKFAALEGRLALAETQRKEAEKQARYSTKLLSEIRKALKIEKNSEILEAIRRG